MTDVAKVELTEREIPKPKDDEVLVKVEYVGVCGSDLHYYEASLAAMSSEACRARRARPPTMPH